MPTPVQSQYTSTAQQIQPPPDGPSLPATGADLGVLGSVGLILIAVAYGLKQKVRS